jgi:ribosomal-protein-alanine N-acetyltransferase
MRETLRRLVSRGDARVNLTVRVSNQDAIRLYLRFGFRRVRRVPGYYEDGEDGWRMRKMLTA